MGILYFTLRNMGILIFYHYRYMWGRSIEIRAEPDVWEVRQRPNRWIYFVYILFRANSQKHLWTVKVLVASREILMYNLTHRLQVVISYT